MFIKKQNPNYSRSHLKTFEKNLNASGVQLSTKIIAWLILEFGNLLSTNAPPQSCWRVAEQNIVTLQ